MDNEDARALTREKKMASLAVFSMMIFGSAFWAIVLALEDIPPVTLGFLRAALAALFMLLLYFFLAFILKRGKWRDMRLILFAGMGTWRHRLLIVATAFFGTALPNILQNTGMLLMDPSSTSSLASLIQGVGPVFTIFLAWLLLKEKMGPWKITGIMIALPCTVVLTTYNEGGLSFRSDQALGGFLNLMTAISYSFSGLFLKMALNRRADPVALLGLNSAYAALMTAPLMVILWILGVERPIGTFSLSLTSGLALIYISICVYAVAAIIWYRVMQSGDLSRITFYVFLLPVFSVLLGYLLLGERLAWVQIAAGLVLITGVWIAQRSKKDNIYRVIRPPKV